MKAAMFNVRDPWTGAGHSNFKLLKGFQNIGIDVDFIHMGYREFSGENIKYIKPYPFPIGKETLNWLYYLPRKIPEGYDVYHIADQLFAPFVNHCSPNILTIFELLPFYPVLPWLSRNILVYGLKKARNADSIITVSEWSKSEVVKILKIPEEKIYPVYEGVDHDIHKPRQKLKCRKKLGWDLDKKVVLYVGSEMPRKNVSSMIKSFYKLQKDVDNVEFVRVGTKSKESEDLIDRLKLKDKITYSSNLSEDTLALYYNASDVYLHTASSEGFPTTCMEAMASALPVVAADNTATAEVIGNGGILIDPTNTQQISKRLKELLENEGLREEMVRKAHERSKTFSWEIAAEETYKVYEEVYSK